MINIGHIKRFYEKTKGIGLTTGATYKHLNGTRSNGWAGGNEVAGTAGCLSFYSQNHIDCEMSPFYGKGSHPRTTEYVFNEFLDFLSTIHPRIAECIEEYKPTVSNPKIRINTGHGFVNYILMTQWRMIWNSPIGLYFSVYFHQRGYHWTEVLAIVGSLRYTFTDDWDMPIGGMPNGVPFEGVHYYKGTLTYLNDIEKETDVRPYYLNTRIRERCEANGGGCTIQKELRARGIGSFASLNKHKAIKEVLDMIR